MENINKFCFNKYDILVGNYKTDKKADELIGLIEECNKIFEKEIQNFADLCFIIKSIHYLFDKYRDENVWVYDKFKNPIRFETILSGFGIDESYGFKLLKCFEKYCLVTDLENGYKCIIKEPFKDFSKSKLIELLSVDNDQMVGDIDKKVLRPEMSVKTIREYVRNYQSIQNHNQKLYADKGEEKNTEINMQDIPDAYNPKKHYDFEYFKSKGKAQLLNIIWELQREYEKLKKKKQA